MSQQDELESGHTPECELIRNPKLTCNDVITQRASARLSLEHLLKTDSTYKTIKCFQHILSI